VWECATVSNYPDDEPFRIELHFSEAATGYTAWSELFPSWNTAALNAEPSRVQSGHYLMRIIWDEYDTEEEEGAWHITGDFLSMESDWNWYFWLVARNSNENMQLNLLGQDMYFNCTRHPGS